MVCAIENEKSWRDEENSSIVCFGFRFARVTTVFIDWNKSDEVVKASNIKGTPNLNIHPPWLDYYVITEVELSTNCQYRTASTQPFIPY